MFSSRIVRLTFCLVFFAGGGIWFYSYNNYPIRNAPPHSGPIVAFGDSLTAGFGASPGKTYPDQLSRVIGRPVINAGMNGDTIADAAARLDRDVLARKPAIVLVLLGGNDFLRRKDLNQSFVELEGIVRRIQDSGAMVVLVGLRCIAPIFGDGGRYTDLAHKTGCVLVTNVMGGILTDRRYLFDQIHPNDAGYALMTSRIAKALTPYVK